LLIFIIYIYFEQKWRHSFALLNEDSFNYRFLSITQKVSDIFKNRVRFSNFIFVLGIVIGILLFILDANKYFIAGAVGLVGFILIIFLAASISGDTWINRIYSCRMAAKVFKGLIIEFFFGVSATIFILIVLLILIRIFNISQSSENIRRVVYAFPVFAILWVYRFNDYNERYNFQLNIRRLIMYLVVTIIYLVMKDPNFLMFEQSLDHRMDNIVMEIVIVAFITLDRVAKIIIEILREASEQTTVKKPKTG